MRAYLPLLVFAAFTCQSSGAEPPDFDKQVATILAEKCLPCHSGSDPKGKLDLSRRDRAMQGGESGKAIVGRDLEASLLWNYVESDEMPPKKSLSMMEKQVLKAWIVGGAAWGKDPIDPFRTTTDERAGYDWWSLQPIKRAAPPKHANVTIANPIDAFVQAPLRAAGLTQNKPADRATLIRRLCFDLTGLPPTETQIAQFAADTSPDAYDRLVASLLDSPHYGERWGRHWLDVVRFGESNGFEYDQPRNNAWPYRNWVIRSLNSDMPYDQFVRLQLAGDLLDPDNPDAIAATGFLVAGPHNTTLPASDKMRMTMAQDELEDLVASVGQTFLGLTANCARCHDHKFDPISQKEYYQFAAALAGVTHGERTVPQRQSPQQRQERQRLVSEEQELAARIAKMLAVARAQLEQSKGEPNKPASAAIPTPYSRWDFDSLDDSQAGLKGKLHGAAKLDSGTLKVDGKQAFLASSPLPIDLTAKTLTALVQLDNLKQRGGAVVSIQSTDGVLFDAIVFGEREAGRWMAGSNNFARTRSFQAPAETEAEKEPVHVAIVYRDDGTIVGYRNGLPYGKPYRPGAVHKFAANKTQLVFGLRHGTAAASGRMLEGRIIRSQLFDRALNETEVAAVAASRDDQYIPRSALVKALSPEQRLELEDLEQRLFVVQSKQRALRGNETQKMYTCVAKNPGVSRVLRRGNVSMPGDQVAPGGLAAVGVNADFGLANNASDRDRRLKLAQWITHPDNPLLARVIVNRIWHYYFGRGLVTTPSDFGFNGGRPSHPELLDWLASEFVRNGFRLKSLHRLIVNSATYKQSAAFRQDAHAIDADNRLLWRKSPKRLEAEAIRDAMLVMTGKLNTEVGGIGYRDVRHFQFKGSNFYEPIDDGNPQAMRRTIYRFTPRGGRNPFLDTFDCPDPSAATPNRAATTTPLQSLALMNNQLVFQMSDALSAKLVQQFPNDLHAQVSHVYRLAYTRTPTDLERERAAEFATIHGLSQFCRVVLNSNEFLYVR